MTRAAAAFRRKRGRDRGANPGPPDPVPALLGHWIRAGRLSPADVRELVTELWAEIDEPRTEADVATWRALLEVARLAGGIRKPARPLVVYRAAADEPGARGMGWTTRPLVARRLAEPWRFIWTVTAPAAAVLLVFDDIGQADVRLEGGVIVDPRLLPPPERLEVDELTPDERKALAADRRLRLRRRIRFLTGVADDGLDDGLQERWLAAELGLGAGAIEADDAARRRRAGRRPKGDHWATAAELWEVAGSSTGPHSCTGAGRDCLWPPHTSACLHRRARATPAP